jgi:hypothetical protein
MDQLRESPLLPRSRAAAHPPFAAPPPPSKSMHHISKAARNGYAVPHKAYATEREPPFGGHNSFSDLESTRIDFDESITNSTTMSNNNTGHNQTIESDNNSDIVIDEKKMVSEGSDFKIVLISSESKSGSELNSSLECAEAADDNGPTTKTTTADDLRHVTGDYIDEMDWVNYQKKVHPRTAGSGHMAAGRRLSDSPRTDAKRSPRLLPDPDRR